MASADDVVVPPHIPITRRLVDAPPPKKKAKADKNELDNADEATHEYDSADLASTGGKAPCVGAGATTHMSLTHNKRYALKARLWQGVILYYNMCDKCGSWGVLGSRKLQWCRSCVFGMRSIE